MQNIESENNKYISLSKAVEYCNYSQEYLSLRSRQGKLKAVKFGRNWLTTKEWIDEYIKTMPEYNNKNVAKEQRIFTPPSNLPVRDDLFGEDKEPYGANLLDYDLGKILAGLKSFKNRLEPEMKLRFAFVVLFTISSFITSIAFGQEYIKSTYNDFNSFALMASQEFDRGVVELVNVRIPGLIESTASYVEGFINKTEDVVYNQLANLTNSYADARDFFVITEKQIYQELSSKSKSIGNFVQTTIDNYITSDKLADQYMVSSYVGAKDYFVSLSSKILNNYVAADKLIDEIFIKALSDANNRIKGIVNNGAKLYINANKNFDQKISSISEFFAKSLSNASSYIKGTVDKGVQLYVDIDKSFDKKVFDLGKKMRVGLQFVINPWQGSEIISSEPNKDIQDIKSEIAKLKEERLPVKEIEVSKITRIEPIKEITKEIIKVSDAGLALMEARVVSLEENIVDRLYAPNGVVSQMVYVTQPLASPKFYQENGDIVLQTVGSGSVIISAATGAQISGRQIMIDSTDSRNPLVVINDQTEVRGPMIINPPSYYTGMIFDVQLNSASLVSVDQTGSLSIAGTTTFLEPLIVNVDSTTPALSITQSGTGDLISLSRTGGGSFVINEDGFIVGTGTLKINEPGGQVWEMGVVAGTLSYTDAMALTAQASMALQFDDASGFTLSNDAGTTHLEIDTDGKVTIKSANNKDIVLDAGTGSIMLKSQLAGDDIIQNIIPIFGFDLPAQTLSATYKTVSRVLEDDPFAAAPTGTTRRYKFIIRYADELAAGTSSWSICPAATLDADCAETFTVPYSTTTDLDKGNVFTTGFITPTAYPWRLSVKTDGTNHIRVYQVFLAAYDQVN